MKIIFYYLSQIILFKQKNNKYNFVLILTSLSLKPVPGQCHGPHRSPEAPPCLDFSRGNSVLSGELPQYDKIIMLLREITARRLHIVLTLPARGSANNSLSFDTCMKNALRELLETCILCFCCAECYDRSGAPSPKCHWILLYLVNMQINYFFISGGVWELGAEQNICTEERWSDRRLEKTA
jgi:hypothetical protein